MPREIEDDDEQHSADDEPVFVVEGAVADEEGGNHEDREEKPGNKHYFTDVELGHIEALGIVAVKALLEKAHLAFAVEQQDTSKKYQHRRKYELVPENHEIVGKIARFPRDNAVLRHLEAHNLVATWMHAESTKGESRDEKKRHKEHASLTEGGTTRFGEGAETNIIHGYAEDCRHLEQVVVDELAANTATEKYAGHGDGERVNHQRNAEKRLRPGKVFLGEHNDDSPRNGHYRRYI